MNTQKLFPIKWVEEQLKDANEGLVGFNESEVRKNVLSEAKKQSDLVDGMLPEKWISGMKDAIEKFGTSLFNEMRTTELLNEMEKESDLISK